MLHHLWFLLVCGDLLDDRAHFIDRKCAESLRIFLEQLAGGPLDGEEVHPRPSFADLDRAHNVRMLHPLAVPRLAKKPRYRCAILPQLFAQHFNGDDPMVAMLRAEDGGRSAFTHFALQRISSNRLTDEVLTRHAANLIRDATRRKRTTRRGSSLLDK